MLKQLFNKYQCDKSSRHGYDKIYEPIFEQYKKKGKVTILEIGVFKGASTMALLDYFGGDNVEIVAMDIFERVPLTEIYAFNHKNVTPFQADSTAIPSVEFTTLMSYYPDGFDIIIDDGLHTNRGQWMTFINYIDFLADDGVYFIEDVWALDDMTPEQKKFWWIEKYKEDINDEQFNNLLTAINDYKVIRHDHRADYHEDSYILEIRK